jgi:frataxin
MMLRLLQRSFALSQLEYTRLADNFLDNLYEELDLEVFDDVLHSDGTLTLKVTKDQIYVINKQTPNQQIWLSSPFS